MQSEDVLQGYADSLERLMVSTLNGIMRRVAASVGYDITAAAGSAAEEPLRAAEAQWMEAVGAGFFPRIVEAFHTSAEFVYDQVVDAYDGPAEDVPFVSNEFAVSYLTDTANRMVATTEGTWTRARAQLIEGFSAGESIEELSSRLMTISDWSERRAATVARTEIISASNAGALAEMQAFQPDASKVWLATMDSRTREAHRDADGETVLLDGTFTVDGEELSFPGDPGGSPGNIINCVIGSTLVDAPMIKMVMRSWFDGDLVIIRTAAGKTLSVTPNHPVLTIAGWQSARNLQVGDDVICGDVDYGSRSSGDEKRGPTEIAEIYRSASILGESQRIGESVADFHGERRDADVYVVPVDGLLRVDGETSTAEDFDKFSLTLTDKARTTFSSPDDGVVPLLPTGGVCHCVTASGSVGGPSSGTSGVRILPRHDGSVDFGPSPKSPTAVSDHALHDVSVDAECLGDGEYEVSGIVSTEDFRRVHGGSDVPGFSGSACDSSVAECTSDDLRGNADLIGDFCHGQTLSVSTDRIVDIERRMFSGHVYNLATGGGWYTGNGITTQNCRCTLLFNIPRESLQTSIAEMSELPDVTDEFDPEDFVDWDTLVASLEFARKPFEESKHNRGKGGKFAPKAGGRGKRPKINYRKAPKAKPKISYVKPAKKSAPAKSAAPAPAKKTAPTTPAAPAKKTAPAVPAAPAKKTAAPVPAKKAVPPTPPPAPVPEPTPEPVPVAPQELTPNTPLVSVTQDVIDGLDTDSGEFAEQGHRVIVGDRLGTVRHTRTDESGLSDELFVQFDDNPTEVESVSAGSAEVIEGADDEEVLNQPFDVDAVNNLPSDYVPPGEPRPSTTTRGAPFEISSDFDTMDEVDAQNMQDEMLADDPWSGEQETALVTYSGDAYRDMNGCLRFQQGCSDTVESYNDNASAAMRPTTRPTTTFRGANFAALGVENHEQLQEMIGGVVSDSGFTSTSISPETFDNFTGDVALQIEVPEGTPAAYIDQISEFGSNSDTDPPERELLLDRSTRFEILEVGRSNGRSTVRIRVIP